jgi:molecular chaperone GrpE (heat shock protein)
MLKKFVILGLVLLLAGSALLAWVLAEKAKQQQQTTAYQSKYGSELAKEMQQYDEWLRLPAEKRTGLPPALDEYGKIKTKAQLLQQQQARLKADMDKLAGGESDAQTLADFLYGQDWQQELNRYREQKERNELVLNGSIVCMSIGATVLSSCLLLLALRLVIRVSSRLARRSADTLRGQRQTTDTDITDAETQTQVDSPQIRQAQATEVRAASASPSTSPVERICGPQRGEPRASFSVLRGSLRGSTPVDEARRGVGEEAPARRFGCAGGRSAWANRSAGQTTAGHSDSSDKSDPLNNTLVELTQQVAAIREYASTQQDRVQKLQEGYDWNIIRNFCLRVIRCIDNVENRIRERAGKNGEAVHLREIRDELLFALESSGIEQFEPEINSDYHGQEKCAEAIKERESCEDPDLTGKIAKTIRPGYHYFIDDKNLKVIRPAVVMLFG